MKRVHPRQGRVQDNGYIFQRKNWQLLVGGVIPSSRSQQIKVAESNH